MEFVLESAYLDANRALEFTKDADQMLVMLKMFRDALNHDVEVIQASLNNRDFSKAKDLLHSLKGFAPIFCSDPLIDHLVAVETLSRTQSCEEVALAFAELSPKLGRLAVEANDYLALAGIS